MPRTGKKLKIITKLLGGLGEKSSLGGLNFTNILRNRRLNVGLSRNAADDKPYLALPLKHNYGTYSPSLQNSYSCET